MISRLYLTDRLGGTDSGSLSRKGKLLELMGRQGKEAWKLGRNKGNQAEGRPGLGHVRAPWALSPPKKILLLWQRLLQEGGSVSPLHLRSLSPDSEPQMGSAGSALVMHLVPSDGLVKF